MNRLWKNTEVQEMLLQEEKTNGILNVSLAPTVVFDYIIYIGPTVNAVDAAECSSTRCESCSCRDQLLYKVFEFRAGMTAHSTHCVAATDEHTLQVQVTSSIVTVS